MSCFFFQAEDGIRVGHVTGVQTCALPISMFFGAVTLLLVFVASSVGDSYAREAWPDRLHALDFVRRLTIVNPYVGSAIWNGFGVAGVRLALSGIALGAPGSASTLGGGLLPGLSYRPVMCSTGGATAVSP